jgi:transposase
MRRRDQQGQQEPLWIAHTELPRTVAHPFYEQVNRLLEKHAFDPFVEGECAQYYAAKMGRPSLAPGMYFRLLLIGYFEGIDSERGIAWRAGGLAGAAAFSAGGLGRDAAGSLDDLAHTAADCGGDA